MSELRFRCVRDEQSGRTFYQSTVKFAALAQLVREVDSDAEPEKRRQRPFDKKHGMGIVSYVEQSPKAYILPCITLALKGKGVKFQAIPDDPDMGYLIVPLSVLADALDGQHRTWAASNLPDRVPDVAQDAIPVTFHLNLKDEAIEQFFTDINENSKKVSRALSRFFDHRDVDSCVTRKMVEKVKLFKQLTLKDGDTVPQKSAKLFPYNGIFEATEYLLCAAPDVATEAELVEFACTFWNVVIDAFPRWEMVYKDKLAASEVRKDSFESHAITLVAIAKLGVYCLLKHPSDWQQWIAGLEDINWRRDNPDWNNRIVFGGKINKSTKSITAMLAYIKQRIGLELTTEELKVEQQVRQQQQQPIEVSGAA